MNHLTDDEIQSYLDNAYNTDSKHITQHLKACPRCQQQINIYKQVYESVNNEPTCTVSPNFSENIVKNIESREERKYRKWEFILSLVAVLQGVVVAYYFIDFNKLVPSIPDGALGIFQTITSKIGGMGNGTVPLLLFAILIIGFYAFIDRLLDQYKHYLP